MTTVAGPLLAVDVSLEKDDYILTGAVDLLLGDDGSLEVLDFKSQTRPPDDAPVVRTYYQQPASMQTSSNSGGAASPTASCTTGRESRRGTGRL